MSTRRDDESRPKSKAASQRQTARDVPLAKYKEVPVGTSPPGALRGPSLVPGQGAPERIVPEEVELAVLRDAETLDGPNVARIAAKRQLDLPSSPSPMPVSVEVPRGRSVLPASEELSNTPPAPSARSIQSGTLMSIGSVDPRAPTELSLPSPRPLSVSERAAYFGPAAVVDRSIPPAFEAAAAPSSRTLPVSTPSVRPSSKLDSAAPPAHNFARPLRPPRPRAPLSPPSVPPPPPSRASAPLAPASRAPASRAPASRAPASRAPASRAPASGPPESSARPAQSAASRRGPLPPSEPPDVAPRFQIHSEIEALNHEPAADNFDLRSAHTQREPLASRKAQPSSDWLTVHAPASEPPPIELRSAATRSSTSAITLLVDRDRQYEPPRSEPLQAHRAAVPVTWLLAGLSALLLLLLLVWIARAPSPQDSARAPDDRATASAPSAVPLLAAPSAHDPVPLEHAIRPHASAAAVQRSASGAARAASAASAARSADPLLRDSAAPGSAPPAAGDSSAKAHQSIY